MPAPSNSTGDPDADAVIGGSSSSPTPSQALATGDPDADAVIASQQTAEQPSALNEYVGRPLGMAARALITGAGALPLAAMDAGVATRNLGGDIANKLMGRPATPDYEMPSTMFQNALTDVGLPVPKTPIEKGTSFVESTLAGGAMPSPAAEGAQIGTIENSAQQAVRKGISEGYRVPPATTNPTFANRALETASGKIATQQAAASANQSVTNRLAAQALGLNPEVPLTKSAIQSVRATAAQDYAAIGNVPKIPLDDTFTQQIQSIVSQFNKTAEEIPSLANKDLDPVASELSTTPQLSGQAALGAIRGLRNKAETAFRAGDGGTGSAYKQMANALEDAVDRGISSQGPEYQGVVDAFRTARQRIAIAHSVEDAFNPSTGNVIAPKLGTALKNGEPLSGHLRTIAEFSNSFKPAVTAEPNSSPVSHLDIAIPVLSAGAEMAARGHSMGSIAGAVGAAAAYPAARGAARWYLMGPGQKAALSIAKDTSQAPWWWRAAPAATEASQE